MNQIPTKTTKTTNFLLEIMEDKIKFDLSDSLKEPSKHDKQEYMNLFKIKLNSLLKTKLIQFKQCDNCEECFNKNYFKCYHIGDYCDYCGIYTEYDYCEEYCCYYDDDSD
jgi:hypothetical protein